MEQKTTLDKIASGMLTGAALISLLCMVTLAVLAIYGFIEGLGDSNGGGWLIFIIMVIGIVLIPSIVLWIAQLILYFQMRSRYKKGNLRSARNYGIADSIVTNLNNLIFAFMGAYMLVGTEGDIVPYFLAFFLVPVLSFVYMLVPMVLLIISKNKNKLAQN